MGSIESELQDFRARVAGAAAPGMPGSSYNVACVRLLELAPVALEAGHAERALLAPDLTPEEIELRGELILARERLDRADPAFLAQLRRAS